MPLLGADVGARALLSLSWIFSFPTLCTANTVQRAAHTASLAAQQDPLGWFRKIETGKLADL